MKTYEGIRGRNGCAVTVDGQPLSLRLDSRNHGPTGFEWGYGGSGPSQLALAILADALGDELALWHYHDFKRDVICGVDLTGWQMTEHDVRSWLASSAANENGE